MPPRRFLWLFLVVDGFLAFYPPLTLTSDHGNVHARDTFDGKGGTINAGKYFSATAGKTFNFQPQTSDIDGSADRAANRSYHSAHQIEDSGQLKRYATGSTVILGGAKETNLKTTQLDLGDKSSRTIISGDKVNLGAEYTHDVKMDDQGGSNYHYRYHGEDKGVETTGDGALSVSATAGKLTVNAAKLNSGNNRVSLYGAKGIDVTHSEIIDKEVTSSNRRGGGLISRSRTRDYQSWESHQVKSSDITGDTVALVADRGDINAVGSNIVGEHGALLQTRQGDITLKAGENAYHSEERHSKHKVGLMGSGGIGVTLGSRSQSSDNTLDLKGHTPTLVGAIDGNATIHAGRSDTLRIPRHQFCHFINCYSTTEPFQQLWSQFIDSHPKPQKCSLASHNCYYFIGYHLAISIYAVLLFSPFQVVPVFTSTQRTAVFPSCRLQLVILAPYVFASSACA